MAQRAGRDPIKNKQKNPPPPAGETFFLGIGINDYTHWPKLGNAVRDVQAIAKLLVNDFGIHHTTLLLNEEATRGNILHQLENLADTLGDTDNLIIYYAGHGHLKKQRKRGYWVPVDAVPGKVDQLINNAVIKEYIKDIPTRHTLLISDACFSGSLFIRGERSESLPIEELIQLPSRWAICSGRHDETVADGPRNGHSPFAKSILNVLQRTPRPAITTNFLYEQVREQTRANYKQMPDGGPLQFAGHERGEYVFIRTLDEAGIWADAQKAKTIAAYEAYLMQCPDGKHKAQAQAAIASLQVVEEWQRLQALPDEKLTQVNSKSRQLLQFCNQQAGSAYYAKALALGKNMDAKRDYLQAYYSAFQLLEFIERDTPYREVAQQRLAALQQPIQTKKTPKPKLTVKKTGEMADQWFKWLRPTAMIAGLFLVLTAFVYQCSKSKQEQKQADNQYEQQTAKLQKAFAAVDTTTVLRMRDGFSKMEDNQKQKTILQGIDKWMANTRDSLHQLTIHSSMKNNMVRVAGGTFTMGCQEGRDTDCFDNEKPAHPVNVSTFYISKYEVTQAQWRAVMGSDPEELYNKGCDQCPVERVSWNDIQDFLQKLNATTSQTYRLPTEAEWEYAARGGQPGKANNYLYSGSNTINDVGWYRPSAIAGNTHGSKKTTRPVGGKNPNELGLYDMSGNVYEWCSDWYEEDYYQNSAQQNPNGPKFGSKRLFRSGSWFGDALHCRPANRDWETTTYRNHNIGFRLARSAF